MSTARRLHHTYEEYLRLLAEGNVRLEYCEGEIFAMAGGTPAHAELCAAIIAALRNSLAGRCKIYSSDLKIRVEATDLSTFPDAAVVCGERRIASIDRNAVVNPSLLVEVTSPSTEDYDRGEKLSHYKQLPSLQAVLLVSHKRPQVTVVSRAASTWEVRERRAGERVAVSAIGLDVTVEEIYAGIELEATSEITRTEV